MVGSNPIKLWNGTFFPRGYFDIRKNESRDVVKLSKHSGIMLEKIVIAKLHSRGKLFLNFYGSQLSFQCDSLKEGRSFRGSNTYSKSEWNSNNPIAISYRIILQNSLTSIKVKTNLVASLDLHTTGNCHRHLKWG